MTLQIPQPGKMVSQNYMWGEKTITVNNKMADTYSLCFILFPDNESDTEVPYADIMITVRGVSTPELTQVGYLGTGEVRKMKTQTQELTSCTIRFNFAFTIIKLGHD